MPRTTADIPPSVAAEYAKQPRASAISSAEGDGYVRPVTKNPTKVSKQFGLPKSGKKGLAMKMGPS